MRCSRLFALVLLGMVALSTKARADCPLFLPSNAPTLVEDYNSAAAVLIVQVTKTWTDAQGDVFTELAIDEVLKTNAAVQGKKTITLKRRFPANARFIFFCGVAKGKIDGTKGVEVKEKSGIKAYFLGVLKRKDGTAKERLQFYFEHLRNLEDDISTDAQLFTGLEFDLVG